jgi:hypothetical protein
LKSVYVLDHTGCEKVVKRENVLKPWNCGMTVIDDSDDCVLSDNLKENTLFYIHDPNCFSLTSFLCPDNLISWWHCLKAWGNADMICHGRIVGRGLVNWVTDNFKSNSSWIWKYQRKK